MPVRAPIPPKPGAGAAVQSAAARRAVEHTGFFGVTGTGKSHEAKARLREALKRGARAVSLSPVDEWSISSPTRKGPLREAMTFEELKADPGKLFQPRLSLAIYGLDPLKPQ